MPQKLLKGVEHYLTFAQVEYQNDASLAEFLDACGSNDATLALQLAPDRDAGALTFGLNRAVSGSHLGLARQLLEVGVKWDAETVKVAARSLDAVKLLVEYGFDVNTALVGGGVLLPQVVGRNDEPCVRFLLEHGADPNRGPPRHHLVPTAQIRPIPNSGSTLNQAASFSTPEIFALLLSHGANISNAIPLHVAAGVAYNPYKHTGELYRIPPGDRIPMLEYLLELGLDINAADDAIKISDRGHGQYGTPLHWAVIWGRKEEAKWLLNKGADPDKKVHGFSARDHANRLPMDRELWADLF